MEHTMTLTKAKMAQKLSDEIGFNQRESKEFVDAFFEQLCSTLQSGEAVKLSGIGNFTLKDKKARLGRNPKTGEAKEITARRVTVYRPSQKLKLRVRDYKEAEKS